MEDDAAARSSGGLTALSHRLMSKLSSSPADGDTTKSGNLVFSPVSIYSALSLAAAGARGKTLSELLDALGAKSRESLAESVRGVVERALPDGGPRRGGGGGPRVAHACGVWHHATLRLKPAYRAVAAASCSAVVHAVDFISKPEEARKQINSWVAKKTSNLIDSVLPPGMVKSNTRLVVATAIYFKGVWDTPFDKSLTREHKFHRLDGGAVDAQFMRSHDDQFIATYKGFKVLRMPYAVHDSFGGLRPWRAQRNPDLVGPVLATPLFFLLMSALTSALTSSSSSSSASPPPPRPAQPPPRPASTRGRRRTRRRAAPPAIHPLPSRRPRPARPAAIAAIAVAPTFPRPNRPPPPPGRRRPRRPPRPQPPPGRPTAAGHPLDREYSMCVFLPDARDGLRSLEEEIAASGPGFLAEHMPRSRVEVGDFRVPKFKLSFYDSLKRVLEDLGVKAVFDPNRADLPDMVEGSEEPLYLADVFHRAVIEVNEEGTEAAASTALLFLGKSCGPGYERPKPVDFVADHPFTFFVVEEVSGAILFAGHVLDPTKL
ncbi:unnamed protein product [Urochloa decumbens]|uniref:Serpin domain-containing protein n=1 Tax=Urochloa decumbens TaxID=240449 RepID=A0ABC9E903_9POAL